MRGGRLLASEVAIPRIASWSRDKWRIECVLITTRGSLISCVCCWGHLGQIRRHQMVDAPGGRLGILLFVKIEAVIDAAFIVFFGVTEHLRNGDRSRCPTWRIGSRQDLGGKDIQAHGADIGNCFSAAPIEVFTAPYRNSAYEHQRSHGR